MTAFDDAIADGVDIITIAVALQTQLEPTSNVVALGALHALKRGLLIVSCAGNSGPKCLPSVMMLHGCSLWQQVI